MPALTPEQIALVYREFRDHRSFCRSSLIVEREDKQLVPLELSPGQLRLEEAIKRQRERGKPVRIIYLKSRRIHATTGTAARFVHDTAFQAGVHTAAIAHDDRSTQNIFAIYKRFIDRYRPFAGMIGLPPYEMKSERVEFAHAGDPQSSFIQVATAGSRAFGRSFRLTNVHFSEFPYYPKPGDTLAAVMAAVPKTADTTAIIEGTAKTIGDLFHTMWQAAMDPASESEWLGLFMGWWEHAGNRMPLAIPADRFEASLTTEEGELRGRYNLKHEQINWRRWTIANDCLGDMVRFRREHPATPEEAFAASARNRFSVPHIQAFPIQRDPAAGELFADAVGTETRIVFAPGERGALRVWKRPEKGRLYAIGADCAQGIDAMEGDGQADPDYSVGQVIDRDTGEQVAVLRARMMPGETGRYMALLGRFYNMAQVCGERNPGGGGVSMLEAMLNADYPAGLIYHRPVTPDQDPQVRGDRIGWDTSGVSRPLLIGYLDEAIRQNALIIHDAITQTELLTFVIGPRGKAEAQAGCHDDTTIALALAVVVCMRMPRPIPPKLAAPPELRPYGQAPRNPDDRRRAGVVRVR
jgi:hypothetical protein